MSSEKCIEIPKIDFCGLELSNNSTPKWGLVRAKVKQSLEEFGCFEASFDKIPYELMKSLFVKLEELFNLPLETKMKNASKKPFHGYVGQYPVAPLFESMGVDDSILPQMVETFTNVLWPNGNPSFSKVIQTFSEELSKLDQIVRRMVLESLGIEKYLEEHLESTNYLLRVMKYKGPQTDHPKLGLHPHTDKNIVTILCQNQVEGLELQTKNGGWISLKPSPSHPFIVMIGDSFHALTNGRLHSPHHRVIMSGNEARYSAGLFSIPRGGYMVKAPKELIDNEHPCLFKPFDHVEFLKFYYTEAGQTAKSALKTYCGA